MKNPYEQFGYANQPAVAAAEGNPYEQFGFAGEKGFTGRVKDAYADRIRKGENIADQYVSGKQSTPETYLQFAGQGAALGSDVLLEGLKSLGSGVSYLTPDFIEEPIKRGAKSGLDYLSSTPVGRAAAEGANYAVQKYGDFAEEYPRAARNVEAVTNIGMAVAPSIPIGGKSAVSATESLAKEGLDQAAKGSQKLLQSALPEIPEGLADLTLLAQKSNIPVSLPQVSDSRAVANLQKLGQELPFSGAPAFREKQLLAWQKQLFSTMGVEGERFTPAVMDKVFSKVGGEFDQLTKGKSFNIADTFIDDIARAQDEAASLYTKDAAEAFGREALKIVDDFKPDGSISGEALSFHRARINKLARKASPDNKAALRDLENILIDGITSNDPALRNSLSTAKEHYKNLIAIEPLAQKAKKGFINPTQLNNRISRIYGRAHTTGKSGKIGDLSRIGYELLGELGGSDTTQKLLYAGAAGGGAMANAPLTAAALAGNRLLQRGIYQNQALLGAAARKSVDKEKLKQIMQMKPREAKAALEQLGEQ